MKNEELMQMLEATASATSTITGMKKQLTDQGWSDEGAERIVIHWIMNAGK